MRLLLDTHALIWAVGQPDQLSAAATYALTDPDNEVIVSAASAWEIATKYRKGKLPSGAALAVSFETVIEGRFTPLSISVAHARLSGSLAGAQKDPFDRMLAAQALLEGVTLVSQDRALDAFGVQRLW